MFLLLALEILLVGIMNSSPVPVDLAFNCFEPAESSSDEAPIIFLHGIFFSKENWEDIPQTVANATKRKAYALDSRNHGNSPWTDEFNFDLNVVDLIHFMDSHNIEKAILVGHSMGGLTSIKTALTQPNLVEKFVSEDATVSQIKALYAAAESVLQLMKESSKHLPTNITSEIEAEKFVFRYILESFPKEMRDPRYVAYYNKELARDDYKSKKLLKETEDGTFEWKANLDVLIEAMKDPKVGGSEFSGEFKGPALFIYGTESVAGVGKDEDTIHKFIPRVKLVPFEDASHEVHRDFPKKFADDVIDFILNEK